MNSAARKEFDQIPLSYGMPGGDGNSASFSSYSASLSREGGHAARVAGAAAAAASANLEDETCGCSWNCENFFVSDYGEKLVRRYTAAAADSAGMAGAEERNAREGKVVEAMQTSVVSAPSYKGCCGACRSAKVPKH